jgi:site-specific recombinase XerD
MDKSLTATAGALAPVSASVKRYFKHSKARETVRVYKSVWREFERFADGRGESALPASAQTVAEYLAALADKGARVKTIEVKRAAIAWRHRGADLPDPTVCELVSGTLEGIRRAMTVKTNKKEPATLDEMAAMIAALDADTIRGKRDKALLLVGFAGAFRRSELVALDVADVRFNGVLSVVIKRSKTDQAGKGATKTIPEIGGDLCPVAALQDWLDAAGISSGPLFRRIDRHGNVGDKRLSAQSVALVVKRAAKSAGLDWRAFSGHSLRSGFVTEARSRNVSNADIKRVTLHRDDKMIAEYDHSNAGAIRAVKAVFGEQEF